MRNLLLLSCLFLFSFIRAEFRSADAFVAEATEIIGVVRLGVSLVEYIYKVFAPIIEKSDVDLTGKSTDLNSSCIWRESKFFFKVRKVAN